MMNEYPPKRKLRPVVQQTVIAYRTRNSLTPSNIIVIERFDCSGVSVYVLNGLSLPTPYVEPSNTEVVHECR